MLKHTTLEHSARPSSGQVVERTGDFELESSSFVRCRTYLRPAPPCTPPPSNLPRDSGVQLNINSASFNLPPGVGEDNGLEREREEWAGVEWALDDPSPVLNLTPGWLWILW